MSATESFYADLPAFERFEEFADFSAYAPVPDDWTVLVSDVVGSTRAIAEGRYKAVNMVGAASITAVLNVSDGLAVPFVFGGDGGMVVVPPGLAGRGAAALRALQRHAGPVFGLDLRAAAVPVGRLRAEGHELSVRKLRLNGRNMLAMFAGSGTARVDEILKQGGPDDPAVLAPMEDDGPPDLDGLSCRWEPLAASHGRMIALMVRPVGGDGDYVGMVARLRAILDQDIRAHAPARAETMRLKFPQAGLRIEARALALTRGWARAWGRVALTALGQLWCHLRGTRLGDYDAPRYAGELRAQTDFRKFDGCLRTVLDCTEAQLAEIEGWLDAEYRAGRLVYGLHAGRSALMTCLVFNLAQGEHVHFVDAAGGGFARAALDFKERAAALQRAD